MQRGERASSRISSSTFPSFPSNSLSPLPSLFLPTMPAPSKRPLSGSSGSANKKAKVSAPKAKEEVKRKVPVTSAASRQDALDEEEQQIDNEDWKGDGLSDDEDEGIEVDDDEDDDEEMEGGEETVEGGEEKKAKDPEGELARLVHVCLSTATPFRSDPFISNS